MLRWRNSDWFLTTERNTECNLSEQINKDKIFEKNKLKYLNETEDGKLNRLLEGKLDCKNNSYTHYTLAHV